MYLVRLYRRRADGQLLELDTTCDPAIVATVAHHLLSLTDPPLPDPDTVGPARAQYMGMRLGRPVALSAALREAAHQLALLRIGELEARLGVSLRRSHVDGESVGVTGDGGGGIER